MSRQPTNYHVVTKKVPPVKLPKFDDLVASTRTIMIYFNFNLDLEKMFKSLLISDKAIVPRTKKKNHINKKELEAPYGHIIGIHKGNRYRGVYLRKPKRRWCSVTCQLTKMRGKKTVKVRTVVEEFHKIKGSNIWETKCFCTECKTYYDYGKLKKIPNFKNQVTIVMSLGKKINRNIMFFKDNCKIAGCKTNKDAVEVMTILWQNYVCKYKNMWSLKKKFKHENPSFLFRLVMKNVDFKMGFYINRNELNKLLNHPRYSNEIFMAQYESTAHTHVNVKFYTRKPKDFRYTCLVMPLSGGEPYYEMKKTLVYKKKKDKKQKHTTFIIFGSSEIIFSGRFEGDMKRWYHFLTNEIINYRHLIEEKIVRPDDKMDSEFISSPDKTRSKKTLADPPKQFLRQTRRKLVISM